MKTNKSSLWLLVVAIAAVWTAVADQSSKGGTAGDWNVADGGTWNAGTAPGSTTDAMILVTDSAARFYLDGESFTPKSFTFKNFANPSSGEALFTVRNGANFSTPSIEQSVKYAGTGTSRFLIDNASFTVTTKHMFTGGANANGHNYVEVKNGGRYSVSAIDGSDVNSRFVTNHFVAADSTLRFAGVTFSVYDSPRINAAAFDVRRSRVEFSGSTYLYSSFGTFADTTIAVSPASSTINVSRYSDLVFDNATVNGGYWQVGNQRELSTLTLKGGQCNFERLSLGGETHGNGVLNLTDGAALRLITANNNDAIGLRGTGTVNVVSGKLYVEPTDTTKAQLFNLGTYAGAIGTLTIAEGGTVNLNNATDTTFGLVIGSSGRGVVTMTGGTLTAAKLRLGGSARSGGETSLFRMTGGKVENCIQNNMWSYSVDTGNNIACFKVAASSHPCAVELDGGVFETGAIFASTAGSATFSADGGTLRAIHTIRDAALTSFLQGFATASLGAKGLTVIADVPVTIAQSFTRKSGAAKSRLVKRGRAQLTMSATSQQIDETIVSAGTLAPASTAAAYATDLTLESGGAYSLVGAPTAVTLTALTVTDGRFLLDPGDVVTVTGSSTLSQLAVSFSSVPTSGATCLVLKGDHSADAAIRHALVSGFAVAGKTPSLSASYDEGTDQTTVSVVLTDDAAALTDSTTWKGSDWSLAASWTEGVPSAAKIADFSDGSAPTSVAVPSGATVGAISYDTSQALTLSGDEPLTLATKKGAAQITGSTENTGKTTLFDVPLTLTDTTDVYVPYNSSLRFAKSVTGGGLVKNGNGPLYLEADNSFDRPVHLIGNGRIEVSKSSSLGTADTAVLLGGGTLRIAAVDASAVTLGQRLVVTNTGYTCLRTDLPVAASRFEYASGSFTKVGAGKFTLAPSGDGCTVATGQAKGNLGTGDPGTGTVTYYDQGILASGSWGAFNILEGELVVSSANGAREIRCDGSVMVGLKSSYPTARPQLTVDGLFFNAFSDSRTSFIGWGADAAPVGGREPTVKVVNGGRFFAYSIKVGGDTTGEASPTIAVTNGTFDASHGLTLSAATGSGVVRYRLKDARLRGGWNDGMTVDGNIDAILDNTTVDCNNGYAGRTKFTASAKAAGTILFKNGSVFRTGTFSMGSATASFRLAFDDATWDYGTADLTVDSSLLGAAALAVSGTGLRLAPPSGTTVTLAKAVTGTGGLVNDGEGTIALGADSVAFTGPIVANRGVIDLADAGSVSAAVGGGEGTITNGTFAALTIVLKGDEPTVPAFSGCTLPTTATVKISDSTYAVGDSFVVATYGADDPVPDVSGWRLKGVSACQGKFQAAAGKIVVNLISGGMMIIVR